MSNRVNDKIILFGGSGNLGFAIAHELILRKFSVTAVVRNSERGERLMKLGCELIVCDVLNKTALRNITRGFDIVISSLGKGVSPNDKSRPSFQQVDFEANSNILQDALKNGVRKFVYVSAFHSERYMHLEYFRVHQAFSDTLIGSGIDYSVIRPVAIFSAFKDLIDMAKNGRLIHLGKGDKRTNPIYEGDLAKICVDAIHSHNVVIDAGGKNIYSRRQLNEIIQQQINPGKKSLTIPTGVVRLMLPFLKLFNRNLYDKTAFILAVMRHDTIAPQVGEFQFEEYVRMQGKVATPQK